MEDFDSVLIGAGVVGLSITYFLSSLSKNILVIEKNRSFGMETISRKSEGIHIGIYYPKIVLKQNYVYVVEKLLYEFVIGMTLGILKLVNLLWQQMERWKN
jgi:L-2-hydroxyglutarate oxidase LhgO